MLQLQARPQQVEVVHRTRHSVEKLPLQMFQPARQESAGTQPRNIVEAKDGPPGKGRQCNCKISICLNTSSLLLASGHSSPNTLKTQGISNGIPLIILIDSGSTHSFLDPQVAVKAQASVVKTSPLSVTVANGQRVVSRSRCVAFMGHAGVQLHV